MAKSEVKSKPPAKKPSAKRSSAKEADSDQKSEFVDVTAAFGWARDNAHRFGLIIRYPPGKESITGYEWEPWHMRYVGVDLATKLYSSGQTIEEYFGITSAYSG